MLSNTRAHKAVVLAAVLFASLGAWSCSDDDDPVTPQAESFTVTLNGANEKPTAVATTATGTATITFTGSGAVSYSVNVTNLSSAPSMAHIHGPSEPTTTGSVAVALTPINNVTTGALVSGTFTTTAVSTISLDSIKTLLRNGKAYVNVHTANFPDGEIRGTIIKP